MARYRSGSGHELAGDLQSGALVATGGTAGWFCCPRSGWPGVFASLLDADNGGHFRVAADRDGYVRRGPCLRKTGHPAACLLAAGGSRRDGPGGGLVPALLGACRPRLPAGAGSRIWRCPR